jgi:hypothetical protein
MIRSRLLAVALLVGLMPVPGMPEEGASTSEKYQALKYPPPTVGTTWAILERDGANRSVDPYLSSLGQGESGTGVVTSPPFVIASDAIGFTIRGHDGQGGGRGENYIALVDARKGKTLIKTEAPGNDALQERSWDVSKYKGIEARIEVHDGDSGGAFAWLGVGHIDAGSALKIDFRRGMPNGWERPERKAQIRYETVSPGVPFKRNAAAFTLIPKAGQIELPCGFVARRLFFLGCTVSGAKPLDTCGGIEIHYRTSSPDVFPLMVGFTLDGRYKLRSRSMASYLHASADPYQHYLVIAPRDEAIEKIRLVAGPDRTPIPRITAITCETAAQSEHLMPLPDSAPLETEEAWIRTHLLTSGSSDLDAILRTIRADHRMPPVPTSNVRFHKRQLDRAFRSEGVAVADFDGDGQPDIAAGNVYYAGPDWKMQTMLGEPREFNRFGYSDSFLCFADDLNRDGAMDLVSVGFPGRETYWLENPGARGEVWNKHLAVERTGNESPAYTDVDGDGRRELVFMDGRRCSLAQPGSDPTEPWTTRAIAGVRDPAPGHGLGVGDVNGDGRSDVVIPDGWWHGSADSGPSAWRFHPAELFGGAQMCVWDFDGDGDNDVLGSSAHGYGIAWCEQTPAGWKTHPIDDAHSQTHAIHLADINGDGLMDFVTGKRFWAHNGRDPGSYEPAVLCWFELRLSARDVRWVQHRIDSNSGVGLHFQIVDVNSDGLLDIVTSNKKGVFLFEQVR